MSGEQKQLLHIDELSVDRAGLPIVRDASLTVEAGKITVLLGANGAGKTTLLDGLSGAARSRAGRVLLDGEDIARLRPARRARAGLAHVEQGRTVFRNLSTIDNLRVGLHPESAIPEAFTLFPELEKRRDVAAGLLSGGEQQMLVIARALVGAPKVLLIDEMSLGLAPIVIQRLMRAVRDLADRKGVGILLVEQFAHLALAVADRAYVLSRGEVVYDGAPAALRGDEELLRRLYLGEAATPPAAVA